MVSLLLLTAVVVPGVLVNRKGQLPGLSRFAITGLYRSLSLLAAVTAAIHPLTAVVGTYVSIQLIAVGCPPPPATKPLRLGWAR